MSDLSTLMLGCTLSSLSRGLLSVSEAWLKTKENTFVVRSPGLWNNLPLAMRAAQSVMSFKHGIRAEPLLALRSLTYFGWGFIHPVGLNCWRFLYVHYLFAILPSLFILSCWIWNVLLFWVFQMEYKWKRWDCRILNYAVTSRNEWRFFVLLP